MLDESCFVDKNVSVKPYGSVAWANGLLRWAIGVLQGKNVVCRPSGRLSLALYALSELQDNGYWWQSKRLENWIHRFQGEEFSTRE